MVSNRSNDATPDTRPATRSPFEASLDHFLGPIRSLMNDPQVTEIVVNGPTDVWCERQGCLDREDARFESERALEAAAHNIAQYVGRTITPAEPILDARLPDGSRVCIVLSPTASPGTSINIRRFTRTARDPQFLLDRQAITPEALEFLLLAVRARLNIVVSGGTGSGKTTLLNILSSAFGDDERVIVIEDTRELQVPKPHVVQLEARPADEHGRGRISVRDLFVTSLRMRPDRLVVGEVRRGEALDMIQAMTSGHAGSLTTLHANTPADACRRLETMALMADSGLPLNALRSQVASAVDVVVQVNRRAGGRRMVTHISEIALDEQRFVFGVRDLFALAGTGSDARLAWTGERPVQADTIVADACLDVTETLPRILDCPEQAA